MDILAAVFFVVAASWLILALMYAALVLLFLRIRARGDLDRIYEADFGRLYLCNTRFYIPCGWLLRRYIRHILQRTQAPTRIMTRKERRDVMELLLICSCFSMDGNCVPTTTAPNDTTDEHLQQDGEGSIEGPVCSICLGEYEPDDVLLGANTCTHQFHKDCILDWLQRQNNAECPCCRISMASEDDVWHMILSIRKENKRQKDMANNKRRKSALPSEEDSALFVDCVDDPLTSQSAVSSPTDTASLSTLGDVPADIEAPDLSQGDSTAEYYSSGQQT